MRSFQTSCTLANVLPRDTPLSLATRSNDGHAGDVAQNPDGASIGIPFTRYEKQKSLHIENRDGIGKTFSNINTLNFNSKNQFPPS